MWKFIQVSYIIALLDWEQGMMHRMSGQTQLAEKITTNRIHKTRSSADADNGLDAFSSQSRSTNMVPFSVHCDFSLSM